MYACKKWINNLRYTFLMQIFQQPGGSNNQTPNIDIICGLWCAGKWNIFARNQVFAFSCLFRFWRFHDLSLSISRRLWITCSAAFCDNPNAAVNYMHSECVCFQCESVLCALTKQPGIPLPLSLPRNSLLRVLLCCGPDSSRAIWISSPVWN